MKKLILITGIIILSLSFAMAQPGINRQIPLIGSEAPSFKAKSTQGQLQFPRDFGENWKIIFAHPRNFTPVCSSEIIELAKTQDEFTRMGASLIVISSDELMSHYGWIKAMESIKFGEDETQIQIKFPLVADPSYQISNKYGMLDSNVSPWRNLRGVFFIDPENKVRAFQFYPNEVGRNIEEVKRTLAALQTNYMDNKAHLPANWMPGDDVMLPFFGPGDREKLGDPDSDIYQLIWFMTYRKASK